LEWLSNEAPFQRLVDQIKAMQQYSADNKAKRPRKETIDIVTGVVECSDDEWFDMICKVMETSDFVDRFVKDIVLKRRAPAKKTHKQYESHNSSKDLSASVWGQMLVGPTVSAVGSWFNRKFRRRFRAYLIQCFSRLLQNVRSIMFLVRQSKIKVEFKVLTCLKILGRDLCADEIEEHLKIAESTVNKFFKMFIYNYANAMYSKWVNVPEGENLDLVESTYRRMRFPGCIGSMDVTHIYWDKCPEALRFLCKGKEGKPTVAFQAVVEHTKRIQHISKPFYGATNDITITYQYTYPMELLSKRIHADRVFQTYNREGQITYWRDG
jgi:hypothetical protein